MLARNSIIKGNAKEALLGHYNLAIPVMLIPFIINALLESPFSTKQTNGIYYSVYSDIIIGYAGSLLISLIALILYCGMFYAHMNIARGRRAAITDLAYPIKHGANRYIILGVLQILLSAITSAPALILQLISTYAFPHEGFAAIDIAALVLLFVGIIVEALILVAFAMTPFIMLDDENIGTIAALKASAAMMKGHKKRFILMFISFIGWCLLGIISLFIAFIWIAPYIIQSYVQFYEDLRTEYRMDY